MASTGFTFSEVARMRGTSVSGARKQFTRKAAHLTPDVDFIRTPTTVQRTLITPEGYDKLWSAPLKHRVGRLSAPLYLFTLSVC